MLLGAVGGDFVLGVVLNQGHPSESPGGIVKKREVQALQGGPSLPQEIHDSPVVGCRSGFTDFGKGRWLCCLRTLGSNLPLPLSGCVILDGLLAICAGKVPQCPLQV